MIQLFGKNLIHNKFVERNFSFFIEHYIVVEALCNLLRSTLRDAHRSLSQNASHNDDHSSKLRNRCRKHQASEHLPF